MATVSVWTCPGGAQEVRTVALSSDQYPTCDSGQGQWQSVVLAEPFDPSSLNADDLGAAFAAGFIVMGTGLVIVWCARYVLQAIRSAL